MRSSKVLFAFGHKPYIRLVLANTGRRPALVAAVEKQHNATRLPWLAHIVGAGTVAFDCEWRALRWAAKQVRDTMTAQQDGERFDGLA